MKPVQAFVALGSNLNDPLNQLTQALEHLKQHPHIELGACSCWYGSKAVGPGEQPDYVNGAVEIFTSLTPHDLLQELQKIEAHQGRERIIKWAARTLDLDILWYNQECIRTKQLEIPHPRICERNFVLLPLNDIAPSLELNGKAVHEHLEAISSEGIWTL